MATPLRIAVNARALEPRGSPFTRLTASHLLRQLADAEDLALTLVAVEPVSESASAGLPSQVVPASGGRFGALAFDQVLFPRAAKDLRADLLLYLHASAPIASPAPAVSWYGDGETLPQRSGQGGRLSRSVALAGMRGAAAVLRPQDIPPAEVGLPWIDVPPSVPTAFAAPGTAQPSSGAGFDPESYVLVAGEPSSRLSVLLAAWTWVEGSLGDSYILRLASPNDEARRISEETVARMGLSETVQAVTIADDAWPAMFRNASALLHAGERENAAALRWALSCGLPVAALSTPVSVSILGPAGYLAAQPDARTLGAACLTLLVEEEIASSLRERGRERARAYHSEAAARAWLEALRHAARRGAAASR